MGLKIPTPGNQGGFAVLARLAREERERSEYAAELLSVRSYCLTAYGRMGKASAAIFGNRRDIIQARIMDAIDLAEQELKRLGIEV